MFADIKFKNFFLSTVLIFFINPIYAEEEEIYLKAISDQIQVITKDLKTLETAVYQKSDVISINSSNKISSWLAIEFT